jgi:predicted porin
MTKTIKIALVGALLASTISAASAQSFYGSHDNSPDFYAQQKNSPAAEPNKTDVGEGGGGA